MNIINRLVKYMSETKMEKISYLKGFVIYTLAATLAGFAVGALQGAVIGGALGMVGFPLERIKLVTGLTGFVCGLIVAFFIFRWSIQKFILPQIFTAIQEDQRSSQSEISTV